MMTKHRRIQRLNRAADVLRDRAAAATPGPWRDSSIEGNRYSALVADQRHPDRRPGGGWDWDEAYGGCLVGESLMTADRAYIATMSPTTAVAVAGLLDAVARAITFSGRAAKHPEALSITAEALAVADVILEATP